MEYPSDLADRHEVEPRDDEAFGHEPAARPAGPTADRFDKVAALAYARWEALRGNADLPSISHNQREESRLFTPNCVQVAWDRDVSIPTISYLGNDLAGQFASLSGEAWPNLPIESPLVVLLHDISRRAIDERQANEFAEQITDSEGWIREIQGLALPFAGDEPGTFLVDVMFDLDRPIAATAKRAPPAARAPDPEDILLLDQELDPDEMPRQPAAARTPPVLFVCVSGDEKRRPPGSEPRSPKAAARPAVPLFPAAKRQDALSDADPVLAHWIRAVRGTEEPLLLTEALNSGDDEARLAITALKPEPADRLLASLEIARSQGAAARDSERRSHTALYKAIEAAYDFARLAAAAPERLEQIILEAGLTTQARAPMTPIVKLVFGADYDRTRLAEYATALSHAFRLDLPAGNFADYLLAFDGGLKGVVRAERQMHRGSGPAQESRLAKVATRLREAPIFALDAFGPGDQEFSLVIARRMPDGSVALLGEVPPDERLFCAAARRFLKR